MAESELPVLSNGAPEPQASVPLVLHRLQRKRLVCIAIAFLTCYVAMLIALLVGNTSLATWTAELQAITGSVLTVIVLITLLVVTITEKHWGHVLGIGVVYVLAAVAFSILEPGFSHALETDTEVEFEFPCWLPTFIVLSALPGLFRQETIVILLLGTITNCINLAFRLASKEKADHLLYATIYEVGVVILSFHESSSASTSSPAPLTPVLDLSISKGTEGKPDTKEEPLSSELETIMLRLQRIHSNVEEAVATAKTVEERQRASESEELMRDLMQRLKSRNVYELEKLPRTLTVEDKTYIKENYMPPEVPTTGIRRRNRLQSGKVHLVIEPMRYSLTELLPLLNQLGQQWNFDTDFLSTCSDSHPVSSVGDYLFRSLHLTKRLSLKHEAIWQFFEKLESGYLPNAYHNRTHAADVMYSVMFLSKSSGLLFHSSDLEIAACVVATLGHDVGHMGYNNRYLVNSQHDLAFDYNDISVLEMMHASKTFKYANESKVFEKLTAEAWTVFRRQIIEMILATDMAKHFELLGQYRVMVKVAEMEDQGNRFILHKMLLKCADIGHAAKSTELHERWSNRVMEEFFQQGDAEKSKGLAISMFCDRDNTDIAKVRSYLESKRVLREPGFPTFRRDFDIAAVRSDSLHLRAPNQCKYCILAEKK